MSLSQPTFGTGYANAGPVPLVTNSIGVVELRRLAARISQEALSTAVRLVARISVVGVTPDALTLAAEIPPPEVTHP